jgi:hypothetical protein
MLCCSLGRHTADSMNSRGPRGAPERVGSEIELDGSNKENVDAPPPIRSTHPIPRIAMPDTTLIFDLSSLFHRQRSGVSPPPPFCVASSNTLDLWHGLMGVLGKDHLDGRPLPSLLVCFRPFAFKRLCKRQRGLRVLRAIIAFETKGLLNHHLPEKVLRASIAATSASEEYIHPMLAAFITFPTAYEE